eukprot:GHVL01018786.1.p2 GENE.GHVL01018786.1~~GHVL01018786.1.p2  ORF type:complete len:117 (+),score=13.43 GHVL01018786.1:62-412(+)
MAYSPMTAQYSPYANAGGYPQSPYGAQASPYGAQASPMSPYGAQSQSFGQSGVPTQTISNALFEYTGGPIFQENWVQQPQMQQPVRQLNTTTATTPTQELVMPRATQKKKKKCGCC